MSNLLYAWKWWEKRYRCEWWWKYYIHTISQNDAEKFIGVNDEEFSICVNDTEILYVINIKLYTCKWWQNYYSSCRWLEKVYIKVIKYTWHTIYKRLQ